MQSSGLCSQLISELFLNLYLLYGHTLSMLNIPHHLERSLMLYMILCSVCLSVYIGQTGRLLETRVAQHKAAVKHAKCNDVSWNLG